MLARFWPNLHVIHQDNSGGPSRPRNAGLARVTGRYVFFLDADDYFGPEALERMVGLAQERCADVVACRRKAVGGRKEHGPAVAKLRHSGLAAEAYDHAIQRSSIVTDWIPLLVAGADCKNLYRVEFLTRLGLRFKEHIHFGEDYEFATSCLNLGKVAMVDDYDCYYDRLRDDGRNGTTLYGASEMHLDAVGRGLQLREEVGEPPWRREQSLRDGLMDLTQFVFNERFVRREPGVRRRMVDNARSLLGTWLTPRAVLRMPAVDRLKIDLIVRDREPELTELIKATAAGQRSKDVIILGRVYGGYPYFRDLAVGIPDECYDVTDELAARHYLAALSWDGTRLSMSGYAYIDHVDTLEVTTELVLRDKLGRIEQRWPVRQRPTPDLTEACGQVDYDYHLAGFDVELDLADAGDGRPLPPGRWNVFLAVGAQGVTKEVPIGGNRAQSIDTQEAAAISAYFTSYGTLTLDVSSLS
jgi:CDP-glycerol glycerophosphotransferase